MRLAGVAPEHFRQVLLAPREDEAQFAAPSRGQERWEALVSLHKPQIKAKLAQVTQGRGVRSPPWWCPWICDPALL